MKAPSAGFCTAILAILGLCLILGVIYMDELFFLALKERRLRLAAEVIPGIQRHNAELRANRGRWVKGSACIVGGKSNTLVGTSIISFGGTFVGSGSANVDSTH